MRRVNQFKNVPNKQIIPNNVSQKTNMEEITNFPRESSNPISKAASVKGSDITPGDEEMKIEYEEKKEDVNLEEDPKCVNLAEKKKKEEPVYDIDDTVIRDVTLPGGIHFKLISNVNGYFIDIRKWFNGHPTKKGIRILASKFATAAELLKNDLTPYIAHSK